MSIKNINDKIERHLNARTDMLAHYLVLDFIRQQDKLGSLSNYLEEIGKKVNEKYQFYGKDMPPLSQGLEYVPPKINKEPTED